MKLKTIGQILLVIGALLTLYAMFVMEVSINGRTVNMHLLNTRQNLVVVGGLLLLIGVIVLVATPRDAEVSIPFLPRTAPLDWKAKLGHLMFPAGLYLAYLYLVSSANDLRPPTGQLIAGLALMIPAFWLTGRMILYWLVPLGVFMTYMHIVLPPWETHIGELVVGLTLIFAPPAIHVLGRRK